MINKKLKKYILITVVITIFLYLQFSFVNANIDFTKWHWHSRYTLSFLNCIINFACLYIFVAPED